MQSNKVKTRSAQDYETIETVTNQPTCTYDKLVVQLEGEERVGEVPEVSLEERAYTVYVLLVTLGV